MTLFSESKLSHRQIDQQMHAVTDPACSLPCMMNPMRTRSCMIESVWRMLILMHGQACSGWPAGQAAASRPTRPPMSLPGTPRWVVPIVLQ
jgi:hypothetical protein